MYVPIVPAQGKELYTAVCRPRREEKEWFASRHFLGPWERIGGDVQMIVGRPPTLDTILQAYSL